MANSGTLLYGKHQSVFPSEVERSLVSSFFGTHTGVFVEVGAYDPVVQSQTYHLEIGGWNGVLVEPVPSQAAELRKSRQAQVFEVACVGPEAAGQPARLLYQNGLSTQYFDAARAGNSPVIEVASATLNEVLDKAGIGRVDFVSIDVEGAEPDVLRGFDFARFAPKLMLVDDLDRFGQTRRLMRQNHYKLVRRTGHNAWFVPRNESFPLTRRGSMHLAWAYGPGRFKRGNRRRNERRIPALLGI